MFESASAFNQDISSWNGSAATTAQSDMFSGATAFQAKYTCTDPITGPASSCDTIKSDWVAPSPPPSPPTPPPTQMLLDCHSYHTFPVISLPKSGNSNFQRNSWYTGCGYADNEASDSINTCQNLCSQGSGGCCYQNQEHASCYSNSCSGGGCCAASRTICQAACTLFYSPSPPPPPPSVTPIPDASWHAFVAACLGESGAEVTGECLSLIHI